MCERKEGRKEGKGEAAHFSMLLPRHSAKEKTTLPRRREGGPREGRRSARFIDAGTEFALSVCGGGGCRTVRAGLDGLPQ